MADDERFLEEWLFAWPKGRKQRWVERDGDSFSFSDHLDGENRMIAGVTRENALFLSTAAQHRHDQLTPVFRWFEDIQLVRVAGVDDLLMWTSSLRWLRRALDQQDSPQQPLFGEDAEADSRLDAFKELLEAADVGIIDLKSASEDSGLLRRRRRRLLVRHRSAAGEAWLPLEEESKGTQSLFSVGPVVLEALWSGSLLVVDELEASLHPLLALEIVRRFNDPRTNPKNAQIIFTTQDTRLLGTLAGPPPLRRDQVWLTEKDPEGASVVYPLTDFKPRKAENVERGYLQGRYGAVPFLRELTRMVEDEGE